MLILDEAFNELNYLEKADTHWPVHCNAVNFDPLGELNRWPAALSDGLFKRFSCSVTFINLSTLSDAFLTDLCLISLGG